MVSVGWVNRLHASVATEGVPRDNKGGAYNVGKTRVIHIIICKLLGMIVYDCIFLRFFCLLDRAWYN